MPNVVPASLRSRTLLAALAACSLATACSSDATSSLDSRLTLRPVQADVATFQATSVVVRGVDLAAASYAGTIGAVAITAGRADDSTLAFIVPALTAGEHRLAITIGQATAEATLRVAVTPEVVNPVAYVASVDSMLDAGVAELDRAIASASAGLTTSQRAALALDRQRARASLDSARAAFAAMTPAQKQEAAKFLRATLDLDDDGAASLTAGSFLSSVDCHDKDVAKTAEESQECADAAFAELATIEERAVRCQSVTINTAMNEGTVSWLRVWAKHMVNGCAVARVANWSVKTWESVSWPTIPEFDIFAGFAPDALVASEQGRSFAQGSLAAAPFVWTGVGPRLLPVRMRFRPMIASDIGRVPAATQRAPLLSAISARWTALSTSFAAALGFAPATLEQVTTSTSRVIPFSPARLKMVVQPQAIRWQWQWVAGGMSVTFDADDRSREIPFTVDVIYDGGTHGADTMRVDAILAIDSTKIYQAASLGRWTMTELADGKQHQIDFRNTMWNYGDRVDLLTAVLLRPLNADGKCFAGDTKVGSTCESQFAWKISVVNGKYVLDTRSFYISGATTSTTYPYSESPLSMPVTSFIKYERGVAKLRFTKN